MNQPLLETLKQARDAMKQVDSRPNGLWNIKTELANLTTAIEQLENVEPVASVYISHYKGMENRDFDYWGSLPDGSHMLYAHPAAPVIDKSMLKRLVTQVFGEGYTIAAPQWEPIETAPKDTVVLLSYITNGHLLWVSAGSNSYASDRTFYSPTGMAIHGATHWAFPPATQGEKK